MHVHKVFIHCALPLKGKPKSGLRGAAGSEKHYLFTLNANKPNVSFILSGGSGDADMYIRYGARATDLDYDYRPFSPNNNEQVDLENPSLGQYYVMIRGYISYNGVSLKVT